MAQWELEFPSRENFLPYHACLREPWSRFVPDSGFLHHVLSISVAESLRTLI